MTAIFCRFFDDFMRNSNFGIRVLHVKRQILTYFCDDIFFCSLKFLLFRLIWNTKEVSTKKILNIYYGPVFVI